MLNGIDVSGWQAGIDLAKVPSDFVIMKATGGVSYVSNDCDRQYQQAKRAGKLRGIYHFANDDSRGSSAAAEAEFFVKNTLGYHDGETLLVLDFEAQALPLGPGWALTWLQTVHKMTGIKPILYLMGSEAAQPKWDPVVKGDFGLWLAHWTVSGQTGYTTPPAPMATRWPFVAIHQYSDKGRLPNYGGDLDLNIAALDRAAWMKYAAKGGAVKPVQPPAPAKKTNEQLADEVMVGKWGNGEDRKKRLTAAGHNYAAVQAIVDKRTAPKQRTYVVQRGDSLSAIGDKFGVSWQAIAHANGIKNPDYIQAGQTLVIP